MQHGHAPFDLTTKVCVTWGVNSIDCVSLVYERGILGTDGDTPLLLKSIAVHDSIPSQGIAGPGQQAVHERGFAMIDMRCNQVKEGIRWQGQLRDTTRIDLPCGLESCGRQDLPMIAKSRRWFVPLDSEENDLKQVKGCRTSGRLATLPQAAGCSKRLATLCCSKLLQMWIARPSCVDIA